MKTFNSLSLTRYFTASFLWLSGICFFGGLLVTPSLGLAHSHHQGASSPHRASSNSAQLVCSSKLPVCANVFYQNEPNSSEAWSFQVSLFEVSALQGATSEFSPTSFRVLIWMDMGHHSHGSSPVTINQIGENQYAIEDAFFPMVGSWQIKISYDLNGASDELILPIEVLK